MSARVLTAATALIGAIALAGCLAERGGPCQIDSDCQRGLVCGLDLHCQPLSVVRDSLDTRAPVDVVIRDTAGDTTPLDAEGCAPVEGVFEASEPPCPAAASVRQVTGLTLASEGHGLAPLAQIANQVIAVGFDEGDIALALHVDGQLSPGCPAVLAWVATQDDILGDCTARYVGRMPFVIPNLVSTVVEDAVLDPATLVLTGLIDKQALLESMDENLRDVADNLIIEDTDTTGDGSPDKASAIIAIALAP